MAIISAVISLLQEEESRREERLKYSCKCSFLEIYNEQITDLLDPSATNLMVMGVLGAGFDIGINSLNVFPSY